MVDQWVVPRGVWHTVVPAGAGFVLGGLAWVAAPRGFAPLGSYSALGGAIAGLAVGLAMRRKPRNVETSAAGGCAATLLMAVAWSIGAALMLEWCPAIPLPDRLVAAIVGAAVALVTVPLWQLIVCPAQPRADLRALIYGGFLAFGGLIIMPVLMPHGDHSSSTACSWNLKQLALSLEVYADDYDGVLHPPGPFVDSMGVQISPRSRPERGGGWLMPYALDLDLWYCPMDPDALDGLERPRDEFLTGPVVSYQWNVGLAGKPLGDVEDSPKVPLIFDREPLHVFSSVGGGTAGRYRGVAYADGHAYMMEEGEFEACGVEAE